MTNSRLRPMTAPSQEWILERHCQSELVSKAPDVATLRPPVDATRPGQLNGSV
jgi:hypothetical protein